MLQKGTSQVSLLPVSDYWNFENRQFKGIKITIERRRAWQKYEFKVLGHNHVYTPLNLDLGICVYGKIRIFMLLGVNRIE